MRKNITPKVHSQHKKEQVVAPSEPTISFLKNFARIIYIDKKLSDSMNNSAIVCIN